MRNWYEDCDVDCCIEERLSRLNSLNGYSNDDNDILIDEDFETLTGMKVLKVL